MNKLTEKDYLKKLGEVVAASQLEENDKEVLYAFLDKKLAQLNKKRATMTKAQKENEGLVEDVYNYLAAYDEKVGVSELIKDNGLEFSTQKVSALLKKLVDAGRVERIKEKDKTYYKVI